MINGQECGYQVADSVSDEDSGLIYTLWLNTDLTFTPEATPTPDPQPTPDPKPTPQPEVKPETKPEVKPETKPAAKSATTTATTKTVEKTTPAKKSDAVLATTGGYHRDDGRRPRHRRRNRSRRRPRRDQAPQALVFGAPP